MSAANERTPLMAPAAERHADDGDRAKDARPLRHVVSVCCVLWLVTYVASVDTTIVALLVGGISSDFQASQRASWIGSTFMLALCCSAPLYGRLTDIIGQKRSMSLALALFTAGTFLCGHAQTMSGFLVARTLAGIGGGGLSTVGSVIMSHLVPLPSRGVYQGLTNIVYGLGVGTGAPLGGLLSDTVGWRGAFYLQTPVLAVAFILLNVLIAHDEPASGDLSTWAKVRRIDFSGVFVFAAVPLAALYALARLSTGDVPLCDARVLAGAAAAAAAMVLFYLIERFHARVPIISLEVLARRTGWTSLMANFAISICAMGFNYNFPLYFQTVAGLPASTIGLRMVPGSIALSVGSLASGLYMRRTGRYYWYNVVFEGMAVLACIPYTTYREHPPTVAPFVFLVFLMCGNASMLTCTLIALINSGDVSHIGVATGMSYLFRMSGQVFGVALTGAILQMSLTRYLRAHIVGPDAEELIALIRRQSTVIPSLPPDVRAVAVAAYARGFHFVFLFIAAVSAAGFVFCALMEDEPLQDMVAARPADADDEEAQ
ncbi:hypothetical protein MSPP1_002349 [Malassezia sp. CBS 17886]|nr:hypothetical protein MSPP1_002349 [Malassezia sp. CBS 17886]